MALKPKRGPLGGWEVLRSRHGDLIRVDVERSELAIVVVGPDGVVVARRTMPRPVAGYGGHELLLSDDEAYLALWLYSGQAEVGYEVFEYRGDLRPVARLPYVAGESFGPAFAPSGSAIALAWASSSGLYVEDDDALDATGRLRADHMLLWAVLHLQSVPSGEATTCTIYVRLPAGALGESDRYHLPEALALDAHEARFRTGWGELVRVAFPLPESITIAYPLAD